MIWDTFSMILTPGHTLSTPSNPFPDPAVWKSILPREWRIAIRASFMRVENRYSEYYLRYVGFESLLRGARPLVRPPRPPPAGPKNLRKMSEKLSTGIKKAIRHSRGGILFYTAGSGNGLEGLEVVCPGTQKHVDPKKNTHFCYRKIC